MNYSDMYKYIGRNVRSLKEITQISQVEYLHGNQAVVGLLCNDIEKDYSKLFQLNPNNQFVFNNEENEFNDTEVIPRNSIFNENYLWKLFTTIRYLKPAYKFNIFNFSFYYSTELTNLIDIQINVGEHKYNNYTTKIIGNIQVQNDTLKNLYGYKDDNTQVEWYYKGITIINNGQCIKPNTPDSNIISQFKDYKKYNWVPNFYCCMVIEKINDSANYKMHLCYYILYEYDNSIKIYNTIYNIPLNTGGNQYQFYINCLARQRIETPNKSLYFYFSIKNLNLPQNQIICKGLKNFFKNCHI